MIRKFFVLFLAACPAALECYEKRKTTLVFQKSQDMAYQVDFLSDNEMLLT